MKNSQAIDGENAPTLHGKEQLLYSRKPFFTEPNTQTTYCTLHGNFQPHIKTDNIQRKSRKFNSFKTDYFRKGSYETCVASKCGHDTKGSYCGLLSEYAKGTGDVGNQDGKKPLDSSRLLQKYGHHKDSYGIDNEDSWRYYQKSNNDVVLETLQH